MTTNKQMNKTLAIVLSLMILLSVFVPIQPVEAATEKALSSKTWSSSMTTILKSKNGQSYEEAGMCTGYVAWAINHSGLYDVPSWPSNGFVSDFEARLKSMGVTRVSESEARAGDIVFFGDEHVAILGADGKLHHNYSAGVRSGEHTIDWWVKNGGNKAGSATIYRGFTQEIDVEISITKESADKTFVDGNACYSLSGAKYGVYSGSTLIKTLTINASGKASGTITVMPDVAKNIKIKEISPSKGYGLDTNTYTKDGSSGKITITSKEPPVGDPATVLLYKADAETGKYLNAGELKEYYPQKAGSLEGAVFEVNFYGKYIEAEPVERTVSDNNLLKTWYIETDENGYARLGESWFADGYDQDALYKDRNTGTVTLPLGTVTIQEIVAPAGYHINDDIYVSDITQDGNNVIVHTYQEPIIKDQIKRGDIDLLKIADGSAKRLAGVPFMITALQEDGKASSSGESHIIVTDDNGYASTANSHNAHKNKTNANDAAWDGESIDESKIDPAAGVWFGNVEALKGSKGALPYGTYRIDELPCEANEGYKLIKGLEVTISRDGYTVPLGTLTDKKNELETTVWDSDINEERVTLARDNITLTDRVRYENLEEGMKYTLEGILMDKETEEPILIDGKEVTSVTTFTAKNSKGTVDMKFTFDASSLRGKEIVVFETLLQDGIVVASHEDIDDMDQTIEFLDPKVGTTAADSDTGNHYSVADESVTIIDDISYENLLRGYTYEMVGTLMDAESGEPILNDGKPVEVRKEFEPNKASGKLQMEFTFDAEGLEGKDIVVFEEVLFEGEVVAEHKDLTDILQTIHFPGIKTKALDSLTEDHISYAGDEVTVIDTVSYKNVEPGKTYVCEGTLLDKASMKVLDKAEVEFIAEGSEGTVDVTFIFNASGMEGKNAVVFERLYMDGKLIAKHIDINDEEQTVHFPDVKTTAKDKETGKQSVVHKNGKKVTIVDTVKYSNLLPGKGYKVIGTLMDKSTGKPVMVDGNELTAEKIFTAEKADGSIDLEFVFDITDFKNKKVVVFEKLFHGEVLVGDHEDINDKDQTISIEEEKIPPVPKTGDDFNALIWIILMLAAGSGVIAARVIARKKAVKKEREKIDEFYE